LRQAESWFQRGGVSATWSPETKKAHSLLRDVLDDVTSFSSFQDNTRAVKLNTFKIIEAIKRAEFAATLVPRVEAGEMDEAEALRRVKQRVETAAEMLRWY